ncbi:hypothetical protein CYMTET_56800 [Cymbomonas tetramitiformis]|uniref:GON domain-containing protein n=1 Tax=Cymbomonas tetramitiformis TaxID=36881 RepID=A0AAE0BAK4_9CHLO|nr:hypothetical protein CYMTET_56800 [Cymbomonas tetramitiformis]
MSTQTVLLLRQHSPPARLLQQQQVQPQQVQPQQVQPQQVQPTTSPTNNKSNNNKSNNNKSNNNKSNNNKSNNNKSNNNKSNNNKSNRATLFCLAYYLRTSLFQYNGWYDGGAGASCNAGCAMAGLVCTEEQLHAHNGDVDSSAEVLALITQVGGSTSDTDCGSYYATSKDVPRWTSSVCHRSAVGRALSTFNCGDAPSSDKHRLCYCHAAASSRTVSSGSLTGTIPTTVGALTTLTSLSVSTNQLTGTWPTEIGQLTRLTSLHIGKNSFTGTLPSQVAGLTSLNFLSATSNSLRGTLPSELGSVGQLKDLYLGSNSLTGSIPTQLGVLTELTNLQLNSNLLVGEVPSQMCTYKVQSIDVKANSAMCGVLPATGAYCSSSTFLYTGTVIPTHCVSGAPTSSPSTIAPTKNPTTALPTSSPSSSAPTSSPSTSAPTQENTIANNEAYQACIASGTCTALDLTDGLTDGWYSSEGASCDVGCAKVGLVCTENQFYAHRSEIDSSAEVLALIAEVGGVTSDTNCDTTYGTDRAVPLWNREMCHTSASVREVSSFDCSASPVVTTLSPSKTPTVTPSTIAPTQAPTTSPDGWYDGGAESSCDAGCAAVGLVCTEEQLHAHNGDVDTSAEVLALISQVGGSTSDTDCGSYYGTNTDAPNWVADGTICWRSAVGRALSTFDCARAPGPAGAGKHRLCYCHAVKTSSPSTIAPTTTTPTTSPTEAVCAGGFYTLPNSNNIAKMSPENGNRGGCADEYAAGYFHSEVQWSRLKLDTATLRVDVTDHTYATLVAGSTLLNFGFAGDCAGQYTTNGQATIDLRGTPFGVVGTSSCSCNECDCSQWTTTGWKPAISLSCTDNNQYCVINCGGGRGQCEVGLGYLQLYIVDASLFAAQCDVFSSPPTTLSPTTVSPTTLSPTTTSPTTSPPTTSAPTSSPCVPYSKIACGNAATALGISLGGNGYEFAGSYSTKGCYAYSSGTYQGMAYFGTGGTNAESSAAVSSPKYRPAGHDCEAVCAGGFYTLPNSNNIAKMSPENGNRGGCADEYAAGYFHSEVQWSRLKLDTATLRVDVTDHTYATLVAGSTLLNFGFAGDCAGQYTTNGQATIDLRGTPFGVVGTSSCSCNECDCSQWTTTGWKPAISLSCTDNNQYCVINCGGGRGQCEVGLGYLQLYIVDASLFAAQCDGGWYDSGAGVSCQTGCAAFGLVCTEAQLYAHNDEVDTTAEVLALVSQVGGSTSATSCVAHGRALANIGCVIAIKVKVS